MELEQLRELIRIFDGAGVTELVLESGDERVVLRKGAAGQAGDRAVREGGDHAVTEGGERGRRVTEAEGQRGPGTTGGNPAAGPALAIPSAPGAGTASEASIHTVTSPMVATFYRAPAPGAPPFVSVGDQVSKGQVLCILECMKVMNHMEAEVSGQVREILAENGSSVEYGQPLFVIDPHQ